MAPADPSAILVTVPPLMELGEDVLSCGAVLLMAKDEMVDVLLLECSIMLLGLAVKLGSGECEEVKLVLPLISLIMLLTRCELAVLFTAPLAITEEIVMVMVAVNEPIDLVCVIVSVLDFQSVESAEQPRKSPAAQT